MKRLPILLAATLALAVSAGASRPAHRSAALRLATERVPLPGEGRGDYVVIDESTNRLYVTHTSVVHILDLATLRPIGQVTGLTKAAGVALAAGKGFASDGGGNKTIVFDPATGETIKTLHDGGKPDSILFDQPSGMVFVFNGASNNVSVIDPVKAEVVKTIALSDAPEAARADGRGKAYVNLGEEHAIAVIDTVKGEVSGKFVLDGCEDPAALALDTVHNRIFSSCGNHVMKVVNADTGAIVASIPVGEDPDGIVYDAARRRVVIAARDGSWTIVDQRGPDSYRVNQTYRIDPYAKTAALDSRNGRIYSSTADLVWPQPVPGKRLLPDAKSGTFRLMVVSPR